MPKIFHTGSTPPAGFRAQDDHPWHVAEMGDAQAAALLAQDPDLYKADPEGDANDDGEADPVKPRRGRRVAG